MSFNKLHHLICRLIYLHVHFLPNLFYRHLTVVYTFHSSQHFLFFCSFKGLFTWYQARLLSLCNLIPLFWLYIHSHDITRNYSILEYVILVQVHTIFCTESRISFWYNIWQQYHVSKEQPHFGMKIQTYQCKHWNVFCMGRIRYRPCLLYTSPSPRDA